MTIAILLMAAGHSTRFKKAQNGQHKLLAIEEHHQCSLLELSYKTVSTVFPSSDILIVTNQTEPNVGELARKISDNNIVIESDGLGTSIAKGVQSLIKTAPFLNKYQALFILPADLPFIQCETLILLRDLFKKSDKKIIRPTYKAVSGHPVGFHHALFGELAQLSGDDGAKKLLKKYEVQYIPVNDPGIVWDIDTPEDLTTTPNADSWHNIDPNLLDKQ